MQTTSQPKKSGMVESGIDSETLWARREGALVPIGEFLHAAGEARSVTDGGDECDDGLFEIEGECEDCGVPLIRVPPSDPHNPHDVNAITCPACMDVRRIGDECEQESEDR